MERAPCVNCTLKHIGQARALLLETKKGYPEHIWFAIGHLAEAEDEVMAMLPICAEAIRGERKQLEQNFEYKINFPYLIFFVIDAEAALTRQQAQEYGYAVEAP